MQMLLAAVLLAFAPGERLKVGDPAPDFSATSHTGATVSLKDYAGKRLILWFYPRAGTGGWTAEGKAFEDLHSEFTSHNVAILGCSADPVHANQKFADEHKFSFPLLSDTHMAVATAYGAAEHKHASKARRIAALIDERGRIARIYDPAGTGEFPAKVLADLKQELR